jgi:hypothetical protein
MKFFGHRHASTDVDRLLRVNEFSPHDKQGLSCMEYVFFAHTLQSTALGIPSVNCGGRNVPASHDIHATSFVVAPIGEEIVTVIPFVHFVHSGLPVVSPYVPAGHFRQSSIESDPALLLYLPIGH